MALSRASASLLRIRAVASRAKTPQGFTATQVRRKITASDGDLGGPGGQQPPPRNPGGPEAIKRNWVTIGGGALAAVAAYAYLTRPKVTGDKARRTDGSQPDAAELAEDAEKLGKKLGQQVADQTGKTMREMSGRQKTEQGSFRHD